MAIPKPTTIWDSYFDFDEASIVFRRTGGSLRVDDNG